jgi:C_GCAxxG_C_C family probable redox protein
VNEREEKASLRAERAKKIFLEGANCSESMWQSFCEGLDQDEQGLGNCLAGGFGGGAGAGDLCGAIAGGILVLGLHYGRLPGKPRNARLKELCRDFYQQARDELGSVYCRDLRDPQDKNYREKCAVIVGKMAALIEKLLAEGKSENNGCPG